MADRTSDPGRTATISCAAGVIWISAVDCGVRAAGHAYDGAMLATFASALMAVALAYLGALTWGARR